MKFSHFILIVRIFIASVVPPANVFYTHTKCLETSCATYWATPGNGWLVDRFPFCATERTNHCGPAGIAAVWDKSIRRSETEIAQRAALTLFKLRGSAIWRRFMVIAFEDVGIGSVDAVTTTVTFVLPGLGLGGDRISP